MEDYLLFFKTQTMIFVVHFFYVFIVSILLPSAVMAKVDTAKKGVMPEKLSFSFMPYLTAGTLMVNYEW